MALRTVLTLLLLAPWAPQESWKRIEPGIELVYPRDHGAHPGFQTEWWYITGHLEDPSGARFGFQFTVFRRGLLPGEAPEGESALRARELYAGHLALTDVAGQRTVFAERLRRASPLATAATDDLALALEDWSLVRGEDDALALRAGDPAQGFAFDLTLTPSKPLIRHGKDGYSEKGEPGNAMAYVSWTRMEVAGTLARGEERTAVRGTAWYDHEFGSSVLTEGTDGWDWFGLQLDDGRELMLFTLRGEDGGVSSASATLVARDGTTRVLDAGAFTLARTATWTSPHTDAAYPSAWTIAIPSEDLALELRALVPDCELASRSTHVTYWEGPVAVTGTVGGRGYAELTGYSGSMAGRF